MGILPANGCDSVYVASSTLLLSVNMFILLSDDLGWDLERTVRELDTCMQYGSICSENFSLWKSYDERKLN